MKKSWTAGSSEPQKKEIEAEFASAAAFRAKLTDLLNKEILAVTRKGRSEDLYSSPNWGFQQADVNGHLRALEHVISLIN